MVYNKSKYFYRRCSKINIRRPMVSSVLTPAVFHLL
jgi:hypothetical protein